MHGLKSYIKEELELHGVSTLHKAKLKEKLVEENFKRSSQRSFDKVYTGRKTPLTTNPEGQYHAPHLRDDSKLSLETQRIKKGKCKYCGE